MNLIGSSQRDRLIEKKAITIELGIPWIVGFTTEVPMHKINEIL